MTTPTPMTGNATVQKWMSGELDAGGCIAALDNSVSTDDDVAAMLRYGEAEKRAREALNAPPAKG